MDPSRPNADAGDDGLGGPTPLWVRWLVAVFWVVCIGWTVVLLWLAWWLLKVAR